MRTTEEFSVRIPREHYVPFDGAEHYLENVQYSGLIHTPTLRPVKGNVLYFHGSGARGPINSGPLLEVMIEAGYRFIPVSGLGYGKSSTNPIRYGYGNVNLPQFTRRNIQLAWWVRSALEVLNPLEGSFVLLGQSLGATAVVSFLGGYSGGIDSITNMKRYRGAICNAATSAGLGDRSWNDMNRTINTLTSIIGLIDRKVLLVYPNEDNYAPPDVSKRLQLAIKPGAPVYFMSPGDLPHSWMNRNLNDSKIVRNWTNQLFRNEPIKNVDGTLAVSGPVS